jgi:fucose 4-O-acetylase-like acetyltransferase
MRIRKPALNFIIDSVSFFAFVLLITTGVLMRYLLPPGSGRISSIWGLNRHDWGDIHFWIAVVFLSIMALHLVLHWDWVVCRIKGRQCEDSQARFRVMLAVLAILALLALALSPLLSRVEQNSNPAPRRGRFGLLQTIKPPNPDQGKILLRWEKDRFTSRLT